MGPYGGYVLNQSISIPSRKFSIEDYNFLHNLELKEKEKEKLETISDKVYWSYFNSKNENTELEENTYIVLNRAIKEHRKVKKRQE